MEDGLKAKEVIEKGAILNFLEVLFFPAQTMTIHKSDHFPHVLK